MPSNAAKLGGSASGVLNYLTDADRVLSYYDGTAERPFTEVWGKAAHTLGIERGLTREQFDYLFNGRHPDTGEQLVKKMGYKDVIQPDGTVERVQARTPMIDVVYGTPKSVGEYLVSASPKVRDQIVQITKEAAHRAFEAMEEDARLARVPIKVEAFVAADGYTRTSSTKRAVADLIAVPVVQFTARPTEETLERGVSDPHLHVHVPIFTMCQAEGRWYTADSWELKVAERAKYRDAVFQAELVRGLESIGIEIEYRDFDRSKGGEPSWEIKGSKPEVRDYWSTNHERSWAIKREFEAKYQRPISEVELQERMKVTRKAKTAADKEQDSVPVWQRWKDDAGRAGLELREAKPGRRVKHNAFKDADELFRRLTGANGLVRDGALFDERSIHAAVARCGVGLGFNRAELRGAANALLSERHTELVPVRTSEDPDNRLFTTKTILDAEKQIERTIDEKQHRGQWVDITGLAGTGKSSLAKVAVDALRSTEAAPIAAALSRQSIQLDHEQLAGVRAICDPIIKPGSNEPSVDDVIVVSTAAVTAERTGRKIEADHWGSVESVLAQIKAGKIKPSARTLVVIEEAGQLDTLRCAPLLKAVKDARIVTLGDTEQLQAIGASGWYAAATSRHKTVDLTVVRRQKDPADRDAAQLIRDGKAPEALRQYAERGRFHVAETPQHSMAQMFRDYAAHRDAGLAVRDVKILADQSNEMIDTANRFVQQDRLKRGEIRDGGIEVRDRRNDRRWVLHENDEVLFLSSVKVKGSDSVKNGSVGKIMKVDERYQTVRIRFHETGREVSIPASADIGLGYAAHINKEQGGEMQVALIVGGNGTTSKNAGYVLASRGIAETHVYANHEQHTDNPVQGLGERWQRLDERELAHAAIDRAEAEEELEIPVPREIAPRGDHLRPSSGERDRQRLAEPEWVRGQRTDRSAPETEQEPDPWAQPSWESREAEWEAQQGQQAVEQREDHGWER